MRAITRDIELQDKEPGIIPMEPARVHKSRSAVHRGQSEYKEYPVEDFVFLGPVWVAGDFGIKGEDPLVRAGLAGRKSCTAPSLSAYRAKVSGNCPVEDQKVTEELVGKTIDVKMNCGDAELCHRGYERSTLERICKAFCTVATAIPELDLSKLFEKLRLPFYMAQGRDRLTEECCENKVFDAMLIDNKLMELRDEAGELCAVIGDVDDTNPDDLF